MFHSVFVDNFTVCWSNTCLTSVDLQTYTSRATEVSHRVNLAAIQLCSPVHHYQKQQKATTISKENNYRRVTADLLKLGILTEQS